MFRTPVSSELGIKFMAYTAPWERRACERKDWFVSQMRLNWTHVTNLPMEDWKLRVAARIWAKLRTNTGFDFWGRNFDAFQYDSSSSSSSSSCRWPSSSSSVGRNCIVRPRDRDRGAALGAPDLKMSVFGWSLPSSPCAVLASATCSSMSLICRRNHFCKLALAKAIDCWNPWLRRALINRTGSLWYVNLKLSHLIVSVTATKSPFA